VRALREVAGVSRTALAQKLGVSVRAAWLVDTGRRDVDRSELARIKRAITKLSDAKPKAGSNGSKSKVAAADAKRDATTTTKRSARKSSPGRSPRASSPAQSAFGTSSTLAVRHPMPGH